MFITLVRERDGKHTGENERRQNLGETIDNTWFVYTL